MASGPTDRRMIGALLRIPREAALRQVVAGLEVAGFGDVRPAHFTGRVSQRLLPSPGRPAHPRHPRLLPPMRLLGVVPHAAIQKTRSQSAWRANDPAGAARIMVWIKVSMASAAA
jgi:hypothetical protein